MTEIRIRRGPASQLPVDAAAGEPLLTTDTHNIYVGGGPGVMPVKVTGVTAEVQAALAMKVNAVDVGTAAAKDVPETGNAASGQVVLGNDTRLSDSRITTATQAALNTKVNTADLPHYNATEFDGSDIGAQINAAVTYAGTQGGGTVVIPTGVGRVQTPIVIDTPHIVLKGVGKTATVLKASDTFAGTDLIFVSNASDVAIQDMEIDGNQTVLGASNLYGVHYYNSPNGDVSNCNIHDVVTAGVAFYSSSNSAAVANDISDVSGYVGSTGVVASNSANVRVLHNNISRCNGAAARTAGASDDGNGIYFSGGAGNGLAEGNTIRDCGRRGIKVQASDVKTAQNNMDDCAQSGIQLQNTTAIKGFISIADTIRMTNYGTYGVMMDQIIDNVKLVGITIDGPFYTGIDIRNGVTNLEIISPTIKDTAGWGVRIENLDGAAPASGGIKISGGLVASCGVAQSKASIEARPGLLPVDTLIIDGVTITGNGANNAITAGDNQTNVTITNITGGPVVPYGAVGLAKSTVLGGLTVSNFSTDPVINSNSGFTGNLLKFQVAGVQKAVMDYTGGLTVNSLYSPIVHTLGGDTSLDLQSNRNYTTGTTGVTLLSGGTISKTSGVFIGVDIKPVYNETSGSAANTDFRINRTQTAVGSGTQRLFSAGVGGGSYVEKAGVDNVGNMTIAGTFTAASLAVVHKTTHATGGTDVLTPADIGAATAAQGTKADSAVQTTGNGGLPSYASNAAAVTGGLAVGTLYRQGDFVAVVH